MKTYRNILVNALVNLGDVVLTTSAIALLRRAYPEARITMLVRPVVREAVEDNPLIDEVILFDYKHGKGTFSAMRDMVRELRSRHFDLSLSFDRKLRPALLAFLARIPERVGPSRVFSPKPSRVTWLYTKTIPITHDLDKTLQAETYQAIVRGLTGLEDHAVPVFPASLPENERKAEELLAKLPKADKIIGLCVKGTFPLKTWPKEYFAETVQSLAKAHDAVFYIIGAPGDRPYADEVMEAMGKDVRVENFCGETRLRDLPALLKRSDLFLTVDTGATHIAATTGIPMVVLYGCTPVARWKPINEHAIALSSKEPCCPCTYRAEECPSNPKPNCLYHITPREALEAVEKLLH